MMASPRNQIALACLLGLTAVIGGCLREKAPVAPPPAPPERPLPAGFKLLAPADVETLLGSRAGLVVLDMRTEKEWSEEGHLPNATLANYFRANLRVYLEGLDRRAPYLLYCAIGGRARLTAEQMAELGFTEVYLLDGGLTAWKTAGKPVVN